MGNKSKRPGQGKQSPLVADVAASLPNCLAVLVEASGGALDISYTDLVRSAETLNLQATPTETHIQLRTVPKPEVTGGRPEVREGPAGIPLLGSGPVDLGDLPPLRNGDSIEFTDEERVVEVASEPEEPTP